MFRYFKYDYVTTAFIPSDKKELRSTTKLTFVWPDERSQHSRPEFFRLKVRRGKTLYEDEVTTSIQAVGVHQIGHMLFILEVRRLKTFVCLIDVFGHNLAGLKT